MKIMINVQKATKPNTLNNPQKTISNFDAGFIFITTFLFEDLSIEKSIKLAVTAYVSKTEQKLFQLLICENQSRRVYNYDKLDTLLTIYWT